MKKSHWILISIVLLLSLVIFYLTQCRPSSVNTVTPVKVDSAKGWYVDSALITSIWQFKDDQLKRNDDFWIDSVAALHQVLGNLRKQVKQMTIATTEADVVIPAIDSVIVIRDTIDNTAKSMINRYKNPWYDITAQTGKGAYVRLKAFDTVHHAVFRLSTGGLFNKKYFTRTDLSFANKYVMVSGMQTFNTPDFTNELSIQANADAFYLDKEIIGKSGLYVIQERGLLHYGVGGGVWMNGSGKNGYYLELKTGLKFTVKKK